MQTRRLSEHERRIDFDLAHLHDRIKKLLAKCYPTKKAEDVSIQARTLGIGFHDSGLDMDLVPLIPIDGDFGWQPSSQGGEPVKTSVVEQLEFTRRFLAFWPDCHRPRDAVARVLSPDHIRGMEQSSTVNQGVAFHSMHRAS